jgi:hypothetical protein
MRAGLSRRSFLAAPVAALLGWLAKRRAAAAALLPNPLLPRTSEAPRSQVESYAYTSEGRITFGLPGYRAPCLDYGQALLG